MSDFDPDALDALERLANRFGCGDAVCGVIERERNRPSSLPVRQTISVVGDWRVYFNRHTAAETPWCVAPDGGGWEIAVSRVEILAPSATTYQPKAVPDDEDGRPSAWIAAHGLLIVTSDGYASITKP